MAGEAAKALDPHSTSCKTVSDWRHQVQPFITWWRICVIAAQPTVTWPPILRTAFANLSDRPSPAPLL